MYLVPHNRNKKTFPKRRPGRNKAGFEVNQTVMYGALNEAFLFIIRLLEVMYWQLVRHLISQHPGIRGDVLCRVLW